MNWVLSLGELHGIVGTGNVMCEGTRGAHRYMYLIAGVKGQVMESRDFPGVSIMNPYILDILG